VGCWKCKHLTHAGRVCLIKFVVSTLPLFFLSFFREPKNIVNVITKGMSYAERYYDFITKCWDEMQKEKR